jgi:ubiquinol-cytochrome c reductase cytochrome b subunit
MAEAFMGYLLPWGQMSYWGAQVIVNLFAAIPFIGPDLALLIRGDYVVGDATLNRFFAFHVIAVPLVLLGLVVAHIIALHEVGSNNPDGVEIKAKKDPKTGIPLDGIPFHPYYTVHDIFWASAVFLMLFSAVVFFAPEMGGYFLEYNNFIPADPLKTPAHIAPVWYFTPYYSMLRAVTDPMVNVLAGAGGAGCGAGRAAAASPACWKIVDRWCRRWCHRGAAEDLRRQVLGRGGDGRGGDDPVPAALAGPQPGQVDPLPPGWHKWLYGIFVVNFLVLGYLGIKPPSDIGTLVSQIGTLFYFGFFLLMPWWSRIGEFKPVPDRVTFQPH